MSSGFSRIFRRAKAFPVAPGFRAAAGVPYTAFFQELHAQATFDWYMEIGCRSGRIFGLAKGKTIAVDPFFQVEHNAIGAKPALHVFQETSDDFFGLGFLELCDIRLSVSFLDGMHLFEYLLRDFMNTEARSQSDGVILMHDCSPYDHAMTVRDYTGMDGRAWTGDVWKLLPILAEYRPDLKVQVFDCASTGLVAITKLDPTSRALADHYDEIVGRYRDMTLETYGAERFFAGFAHVDAEAEIRSGFPTFRPVMLAPQAVRRPERSSP